MFDCHLCFPQRSPASGYVLLCQECTGYWLHPDNEVFPLLENLGALAEEGSVPRWMAQVFEAMEWRGEHPVIDTRAEKAWSKKVDAFVLAIASSEQTRELAIEDPLMAWEMFQP